jgi:hypothetical protein
MEQAKNYLSEEQILSQVTGSPGYVTDYYHRDKVILAMQMFRDQNESVQDAEEKAMARLLNYLKQNGHPGPSLDKNPDKVSAIANYLLKVVDDLKWEKAQLKEDCWNKIQLLEVKLKDTNTMLTEAQQSVERLESKPRNIYCAIKKECPLVDWAGIWQEIKALTTIFMLRNEKWIRNVKTNINEYRKRNQNPPPGKKDNS